MTGRRGARLPIRWRLTLWYGGLLAGALLLFGLGLYVTLRLGLVEDFEEQALATAALAEAGVRVTRDEVSPGPPRLAFDPDVAAGFGDEDRFVRLTDTAGRVALDTRTAGGEPVEEPDLVEAGLRGESRFTTWRAGSGTYGIVTMPVYDGWTVVGVLQVGLSRGDVDETLRLVLLALAVAAPLAFAVAAGGGYLLAGRALAPVAAITTLAASLDADDLHARLGLELPDDELGRLARTFDAMLARIDDAFARQRRFTGDAAHELRTPLGSMRSQIDLALARPRTAAEYREALRGLDGDLRRLTDLVAALLALARADRRSLPLDRAPLDLAETVGLVIEQFAERAAEGDVTLRDEAEPAPLAADEDLLVRTLVNLVHNALAHTPPGGEVAVGCHREGDRVRLWVADTGEGIPAADRERVFDRFYRIDAGRARERGGSGLGLAICKAIAEAHGGTITLASEPGAGTRVELDLPAG